MCSAGDCGRCFIIIINMFMLAACMVFFGSQGYLLLKSGVYFQSITLIVFVTIVGALVLVLFFGCLAACCDHKAMIWLYTSLMIVFLGFTIFVFVQYSLDLHNHYKLKQRMAKLYDEYYSKPESKRFIDDTQNYLKCCGHMMFFDKINKNKVPHSCCARKDAEISVVVLTEDDGVTASANETGDSQVELANAKDNKKPCTEEIARMTHDRACTKELTRLEPYLFYTTILLILLATTAVLSGVLAGIDCSSGTSDSIRMRLRSSGRR